MSDQGNLPPQAPQFPPPGNQPPPPGDQPPHQHYGGPPQPPKKGMGTGAKVAIGCAVVALLAILGGCGIIVIAAVASNNDDGNTTVIGQSTTTSPSSGSTSGVKATLDEYNRVASGQTIDEVNAIFGGAGESTSTIDAGGTKFETFSWDGDGFASSAIISFQDGKVTSKSQFGLE